MKILKFLLNFFLLVVFVFFSFCNKNNVSPDKVKCLLTRITKPVGETGEKFTYIIEYDENGNPVRYYEAENSNNYTSISYQNNQITSILRYENAVLSAKYMYSWTNDSLSILIQNFYKSSSFEKIVYFFDDNALPIKKQSYWQSTDGSWKKGSFFLMKWENNNLVQKEYWLTDKVYTKTYEYDNYNNVFQSLGWFYGIESLSENNIIKVITTYNQSSAPDITEYVYEYNENSYPYKLTKKFSNNTDEEISFEYSCN